MSSIDNEKPTNAGKRWSEAEHQSMINSFSKGISYHNIAKELERTTGSIKARIINYLVIPEYDSGKHIKELSKKYNIDIETLSKTIMQSQIPKKKNKTDEIIELLNEINEKLDIGKITKDDFDIVDCLELINSKID